ncbi:glycoside hydrolase [Klebsiella pneumoniae subsp. ozaenae]|uniref:Glycoside hydrolase n=1 Tax=Klebsiella pneumoniae subsp. ozaenae TaxID=574 RepID=A0A378B1L8_KLEPO|nr:glycoside hydrolase [Klebsiella pneumoniae subsp. ozaenae]
MPRRYDVLTNWWAEVVKPDPYPAVYRRGAVQGGVNRPKTSLTGTVDGGVPELKKQLDLNETLPQIQGTILFRENNLNQPQTRQAVNYLRSRWGAAAELAASRLCYSACSPCCRRACSFSMFSVMACQTWLEKSAGSVRRALSIACGTCPANSWRIASICSRGKFSALGRRQKMTRIDGVNLCFTPFCGIEPHRQLQIAQMQSRAASTGNAEIMS